MNDLNKLINNAKTVTLTFLAFAVIAAFFKAWALMAILIVLMAAIGYIWLLLLDIKVINKGSK